MQVIVKTNYDGQEIKESINCVTSISGAFKDSIAINFKDDSGHCKTQFLVLDGNTELIIK